MVRRQFLKARSDVPKLLNLVQNIVKRHRKPFPLRLLTILSGSSNCGGWDRLQRIYARSVTLSGRRPDHSTWRSHVAKEEAGVGSSKPQKLVSVPTDFSIATHSTPARSSSGPTCFVHITRNWALLCRCCRVMTSPGWSDIRSPPSRAPTGLMSTVCAKIASREWSLALFKERRTGKTIFVRV
jgi:hypothetical protein